jgi:hypothetical protein
MERLLLRPKMLEDLAAMHALLGDPEVGRRLGRTRAIEAVGLDTIVAVTRPDNAPLAPRRGDDRHAVRGPRRRLRGGAGLGSVYRGEFGISWRQHFRKGSPGTHHVHGTLHGSELWHSQAVCRDWLRGHPAAVGCYAERERRLAAEHRDRRALDTEAKAPLVEEILARAGWRSDARPALQGRAAERRAAGEHEPRERLEPGGQRPSPPVPGGRGLVAPRPLPRRLGALRPEHGPGDHRRCERFHVGLLVVGTGVTATTSP